MALWQRDEMDLVIEYLKKAEVLSERDAAARAVTYNNLACYYRRRGKLHAALRFLQRALTIESKLAACDNPHDTHLNVCAVLSQLGRHKEALKHAQAALAILQESLFASSSSASAAGGGAALARPERISSLAVAYHNLGVELEFMRDYTKAVAAYSRGYEVASVYLGEEHSIARALRSSAEGARSAEAAARLKQLMRRGGALTAQDVAAGGSGGAPRGKKGGKVLGAKELRTLRAPGAAAGDDSATWNDDASVGSGEPADSSAAAAPPPASKHRAPASASSASSSSSSSSSVPVPPLGFSRVAAAAPPADQRDVGSRPVARRGSDRRLVADERADEFLASGGTAGLQGLGIDMRMTPRPADTSSPVPGKTPAPRPPSDAKRPAGQDHEDDDYDDAYADEGGGQGDDDALADGDRRVLVAYGTDDKPRVDGVGDDELDENAPLPDDHLPAELAPKP